MLFNSLGFPLFFVTVFICYWKICKTVELQNTFLLIVSYTFYAFWDWRFLGLLFFSTVLDYFTGLQIEKSTNKKTWLYLSIFINLGFLAFFKYYNFFIAEFSRVLLIIGIKNSFEVLSIILPVGISFYTFHGISYVVDIYKNNIKPTKNFIQYSLFVSYFPLLVAGPIERATHLLPQLKTLRLFNYYNAVIGLRQILWGFFMKLVIADNCAIYVNDIFNNHLQQTSSTLLLAVVLFAFQIYGDFAGYSNIALGCSKLLGIELLQNFNYPYFSNNIVKFWKRWHISLSHWFRDYIYIPLGGNQLNFLKNSLLIVFVFALSGIWHGANYTYLAWGLIHALYIVTYNIINKIVPKKIPNYLGIIFTFSFVCLGWIFFRATSILQACEIIQTIFSKNLFIIPTAIPNSTLILVIFFIIIEKLGKKNNFPIQHLSFYTNKYLRIGFYFLLVITIALFYASKPQQFIYFQF